MEQQAAYEIQAHQQAGAGAGAVINFEEYAMTSKGVLAQVQIIQDVLRSVMRQDEHYGTIPGTKKPSLYKAGAEKLSLTFRLRPEYEIRRGDFANGHREYEVTCILYHIPTGQGVGQGVGSATTMEGKYRYRPGPVEFTGKPVPKAYWDDPVRDNRHLGGKGFVAKKNPDTGTWEIAVQGEPIEHDNPADYYNTVLKVAKKRAHVDAILTATAASDIFTQDVEDMTEVIPGAREKGSGGNGKAPVAPPARKSEKAPAQQSQVQPQAAPQSIVTRLHDLSSKDGEKDGKAYRVFAVVDEHGTRYSTFSDTEADTARIAMETGAPVRIEFTVGKFGNKITSIAPVQQREPGAEG